MSTEKSFRHWLDAETYSVCPNRDVQAIESAETGNGIPDMNGCWDGQDVWIELKVITKPKKPDNPFTLELRTAQAVWLNKRAAAGGCCRLVVGVWDPEENCWDDVYVAGGTMAMSILKLCHSIRFKDLEQLGLGHFPATMKHSERFRKLVECLIGRPLRYGEISTSDLRPTHQRAERAGSRPAVPVRAPLQSEDLDPAESRGGDRADGGSEEPHNVDRGFGDRDADPGRRHGSSARLPSGDGYPFSAPVDYEIYCTGPDADRRSFEPYRLREDDEKDNQEGQEE